MKQFIGILLGGLYGLGFRLLGEPYFLEDFYNLFTITFVWILPIVIGCLPLIFARKEMAGAAARYFFYPILSVLCFFLLAYGTRLEDMVCIAIISFPFLLVAGISGLLLGAWIKRQDPKKLSVFLFLPLLLSPLESFMPLPETDFGVESQVVIEANQAAVWAILTEVPEIQDEEYTAHFFNKIGVPRPIKSQLEVIDGKTYRIGYFSDNLKLVESISVKDSLNQLSFKIHMDKSQLRDLPMDKHILESNFFQFEHITYSLRAISATQTELRLSCGYSIQTRMNFYANFWAERVIRSFETSLLAVLKVKLENGKSLEGNS